jgi:predicted peptidase
VHHGELDDIVSISESEKMVRALERAGALVVKFTRYPELAHDSWTEAYGQLELWDWVFAQRRPSSVSGEEVVEREVNVIDVSGI